ncbi:uncharacterized protein SPPG_09336 [Spizellomyces punctatus DAOM BR117]|uniref:Uncharacterized protein n=1 Tax=Spizellomyces punctatus (strain DAOM BR117) TaxID=645134 RepID=A0A0L0HE06_SPIPD|nr:uncharacterized protein SPPG_09336 [Spizellomyces punctatus DAOM BR117]KNC98998.1 hypothetical protein SPPG_09336 [Spizellomyces punctatus DAOM BR117]|eukprot:XP_016607038.1 hypothetical protein SPPG_09336 [Spizellomyces punctatus DAOM BR117]
MSLPTNVPRNRSRLRHAQSQLLVRGASTLSLTDGEQSGGRRRERLGGAKFQKSSPNILHSRLYQEPLQEDYDANVELSTTTGHASEPDQSGQKKKKRSKPKKKVESKAPDDEEIDMDEEGKWAEKAFNELKEKAELQMLGSHVVKQPWENIGKTYLEQVAKILFCPENVCPSTLATWRTLYEVNTQLFVVNVRL